MELDAAVDRLRAVRSLPQLLIYLRDELHWKLPAVVADDLTFDWTPEELGLDKDVAVGVKEVKQLRPLPGNARQPWGIFFVSFEKKRLPVVVLRRLLHGLVLRKRASAAKSKQAAWRTRDLLFISSYGEDRAREISFAHFCDDPDNPADLPVLRVLGWDDDDTGLKMDHVVQQLKDKLSWPDDDGRDVEAWSRRWAEAFILRRGEVVATAKELAARLADLARRIRRRARLVMKVESERGPLRRLHQAFREALIHDDLTEEGFADMYAQTITYGLFSAAVSRPASVTADTTALMVPVTNPFLRDMLETFLTAGGRREKLNFDELGIQEVVDLLNSPNTHMADVLRDFDNRNPQEDPVLHFYEHFLAAYDKNIKISRGVFYTPKPVVSYIVRSVHELLQTDFGLEDGLASTVTWGEMLKSHTDYKLPQIEVVNPKTRKAEKKPLDDATPFVQILDPATGTATFLVEVIEVIHRTLINKWDKGGAAAMPPTRMGGLPVRNFQDYWNRYVPEHLLPRLHGYELMMAPYAIAHIKLPLKLIQTGFTAWDQLGEERVRIYLNNALEPASDEKQMIIAQWSPALAHEAKAVNQIKHGHRFTVVIGNPPYSNFGQLNRIPFILGLLEDYKRGLVDKKINLDDDFIKFFRLGHHLVRQSGAGVLALITNNAYLDGITHRNMRESLLRDFANVKIVNLHGNIRKAEVDEKGSADENIFADIMQGVAIGAFSTHRSSDTKVLIADLFGSSQSKLDALAGKDLKAIPFTTILPLSPYFLFCQPSGENSQEYEAGIPLSEVFRVYQSPIQTKRDGLTIHFTEEELRTVLADLRTKQQKALREKYDLAPDGRDWTLESAIDDVKNGKGKIIRIGYKPFDIRYTYFTGNTRGFLAYPRTAVMRHMLSPGSRSLVFKRQAREDACGYTYFYVTNGPFSEGLFAIDPRGREFIAPLELLHFADEDKNGHTTLFAYNDDESHLHNFSTTFLKRLSAKMGVLQCENGLPSGIRHADIFNYIYAIVSSPAFRKRFEVSLRVDFPRLPITGNKDVFWALEKLGRQLVDLHVLEPRALRSNGCSWTGSKPIVVEKVVYKNGTAWLDKKQSCGCRGIPQVAWDYWIGGYRVCEKWLKQRKGRTLSEYDLKHFERIVAALVESHRIIGKIDDAIEKNGGWQAVFVTSNESTISNAIQRRDQRGK